ncbi:MAG: glycosyltransferase family 9 protein [Fimbriimonadaceae bacterium]|nr:glycosyltransferase family 9 protein [Fimbriimonadaceae bacterium]
MGKRILVFQIGSIGDTVVSVPAFNALKRHFGPDSELHVLQQSLPGTRPMPFEMLRAAGTADGYITYARPSGGSVLSTYFSIRRSIHEGNFRAVAYVAPAQRTIQQIRRDSLFFHMIGLTEQYGFRPVPDNAFHPEENRAEHEACLRLRRFVPDGIAIDEAVDCHPPLLGVLPESADKVAAYLKDKGLEGHTLWAVTLNTAQEAKQWPQSNFVRVLDQMKNAFPRVIPVFIGGPNERGDADAMVDHLGHGVNTCGELTIPETIALLDRTEGFFGLDTGPTHLAAAIGKRCVAIYADNYYTGQWEPLGEGHSIIRHHVPCGGCGKSVCSVEGHPCLAGITSERVWSELKKTMTEVLGNDANA